MEHREISRAVIKRLPRYYRYLGELMQEGVERISSGELSKRMQITASQIRQDLNNFGGFGQQGYGYNVKYLYHEIGKILGLDKTYNLIIIGDTNSQLKGKTVRGIPVYSMDDLEDYIRNNDVQIAALTLPKAGAEAAAKRLIKIGIRGIWNFAHTDLRVPDDVVVENVHLSESLMRISYRLSNQEE